MFQFLHVSPPCRPSFNENNETEKLQKTTLIPLNRMVINTMININK